MHKKLIAVAVVTALAAPLMAHAADTSIYGRVHLSVDSLDNGTDSGLNVSSNSSRIGFKADKELENGMKALFQLESEARYENSGGTWATRDSFGGLQGDFGLIRVGFFDTPLKTVRSRTDLFGDQIGDARNLTRLREQPGADFDTRFRNGIHYRTPNMNGLTADIHYSTNNSTDTNPPDDNHDATSISVTYRNKTTYIAVANEDYSLTDFTATRIGAYHDMGAIRITALYQMADLNGVDVDTMGVGVRYKMGKTALKAQYYTLDADVDNSDASMIAVGMDYQMDKSLRLYAAYASTDNDSAAAFSMANGGHGAQIDPTAGETISGISLGMIYNF